MNEKIRNVRPGAFFLRGGDVYMMLRQHRNNPDFPVVHMISHSYGIIPSVFGDQIVTIQDVRVEFGRLRKEK